MKRKNTIVIAGAGIVGLVAGALLGQSKIAKNTQIHIIESGNQQDINLIKKFH